VATPVRADAVHPANVETPMLQSRRMHRITRLDLRRCARDDVTGGFAPS
jgi:hypothetical protein